MKHARKGAKGGRPSKFTAGIAKAILEGLSKGTPLTVLCEPEGMPDRRTVSLWAQKNPVFAAEMQEARDSGFDRIAWEILDLAKQARELTQETEFGKVVDKGRVQALRLECEMRLKLLAKWDPRRYAEKLTAELSGPDGKPMRMATTVEYTPELEARIIAATQAAAKVRPPASFQGREREDES